MVTRGRFIRDALRHIASSPRLTKWQASRIARSRAHLMGRHTYHVIKMKRLNPVKIAVYWREREGYLGLRGGSDFGRDVVERRGYELWFYDDSLLGAGWSRWL